MKRQQPLTPPRHHRSGVLKKAFVCLIWLSIALSSVAIQAQTITWTGGTTGDWNTPANWDTGVVPGASNQVVITNATVNLNGNRTIAGLTISGGGVNPGSVGTSTLNVTSTTNTTTFKGGAVINVATDVDCANIILEGATFEHAVTLEKNGATQNLCKGGNTFNGVTTLKLAAGAGTFSFASSGGGDVFNNKLIIDNQGAGSINLSYASAGSQFNGDVELNNTGAGIYFGLQNGTSVFGNGATLSNGTNGGMTTGGLLLSRVELHTPLSLNLPAVNIYLGHFTHNFGSHFYESVNVTGANVMVYGSVFDQETTIIKEGSNTQHYRTGGNTFNGKTILRHNGIGGNLFFSNGNPDIFNGELFLENLGGGYVQVATSGAGQSQFNQNIQIKSTGAGGVYIGANGAASLLAPGVTITEYVEPTQPGVDMMTSGTLTLAGMDVQTTVNLDIPDVLVVLGGTTKNNFRENFTLKAKGIHLNGSIYHKAATLTKVGTSNESGSGGNIFHQPTIISHLANGGDMALANTNPDVFKNTLILTKAGGTGSIRMSNYAKNNQFDGQIYVNINGGNGYIMFGEFAGTSLLDSTVQIQAGTDGLNDGHLVLGGLQATAPLTLNAPQTIIHLGRELYEGGSSYFNGLVDITAKGIYLNGCTFHNNASFTKVGNSGDLGAGYNTFEGSTTIRNASSTGGSFISGSRGADVFNGELTLDNSGVGTIYLGYKANITSQFNKKVTATTSSSGTINFGYLGTPISSFTNNLVLNSIQPNTIIFRGNTFFTGGSNQTISHLGSAIPPSIHNLKIDKSSNKVLLQTQLEVKTSMEFVSGMVKTSGDGVLIFDGGAVYTGASNARYVSGKVRKKGTVDFTFPIGDDTSYHPLTLTSVSANAPLTAWYVKNNQPTGTDTVACYAINNCEHWVVENAGTVASSFTPEISFNAITCTLPANPVLMWHTGTVWEVVPATHNPGNQTLKANQPTNSVANTTHYIAYGSLKDAGTITTPTGAVVCQNTSQTYSVPLVTGATYAWTVPTGWTIAAGQGTHQLSVDIGTAAVAGNNELKVTYTDATCTTQESKFFVIVNPTPATAGAITGATGVCPGTQASSYSIPAIAGADEYIWTLPAGVVQAATGATGTITTVDNFIEVDFTSSFAGGDITVKGKNNQCGEGTASTLTTNSLTASSGYLHLKSNSVCDASPTGSLTLHTSGQTYSLYKDSVLLSNYTDINITSSPITISQLAAGTYYAVIGNGSCNFTTNSIEIINTDGQQRFQSFKHWDNVTYAGSVSMSVNAQQETFVVGEIHGSSIQLGNITLQPQKNNALFVMKYLNEHEVKWAKKIESNYLDDGIIRPDGLGNSYVIARYQGIASFEGSSQTLTSPGADFNLCLVKYKQDGTITWVKNIPTTNPVRELTVDAQGNVYVFMDNEPIHKYDPQGALVWTKPGEKVSISPNNEAYLVTYDVSNNPVLKKYDSNGVVLWQRTINHDGNNNDGEVAQIRTNAQGETYVLGRLFYNSSTKIVLDNTVGTSDLNITGEDVTYVAKYAANGDLLFAKQLAQGDPYTLYHFQLDMFDNIYLLGSIDFNSSYTFGNTVVSSVGFDYVVLSKFDGNGNFEWFKHIGPVWNYFSPTSFDLTANKQGEVLVSAFPSYPGAVTFGSQTTTATAQTQLLVGTIGYVPKNYVIGQATLTGTTQICKNVSPQADYIVTGVNGATTYQWTLPAGATATSGNVVSTNPTVVETTTSGITIDFTNVTLASATLQVVASSGCGAANPASLAINLGNTPAAAGTVAGTSNTCANQAVTYTTTTVAGAYEYVWTFTPNDTTLATVTYTSQQPNYTFTPTTTGTLTVQGKNDCGTGTASSPLAITSGTPPTITAVANSSTNCGNAGGGELKFNLAFSGAATYRVFKDGSAYSGIQTATVGELTLSSLAIGNYTVELKAGQCVATATASVNDGSPLITNIKTSYVSCDDSKMNLFSPAMLQFDIHTAQLHAEFKEYTYTVLDPQGGVIVPETTISGVTPANATQVTGTQIDITNPQRDEAYSIVIKAYKALDPNTGCSNCREEYCQVTQNFTFQGLPVNLSLQGGNPQYVCDAAGTTDVKVIVNANHDNGLSIAPAGGYRVELLDQNGTVVTTQDIATLPANNEVTISGVGVGNYEAKVTVGKDNYHCVGSVEFSVEDLEVQITVTPTHESCTDANDGKAYAVVVGAKKNTKFQWKKADGTLLVDDQGNAYEAALIEQLEPGDYKVVVTVAGICPNEKAFTIEPYAPLLDTAIVEVDTLKCEVIARADLTTVGQSKYPTGPYHVVWYQLKIDEHFTAGDETDESKYTKVYESHEASSVSATEPDLRVVLDEKYLVFKGWYYVEISGPNKCAIKSAPTEIERPRKKRTFKISLRWKTPEVKPKEPELPKFEFQVAFEDAKEQMTTITEKCVQDEQEKLAAMFKAQCKAPGGNLEVTFEQIQHHYTLYYFDRAGQLTQTVPPAGVRLLTSDSLNRDNRPAHTMRTTYNYNSLGQMVNQHTPDGGTTNFVHDKLGRIRFSQNDKQKNENAYAYVKYDALGRTIEAGRATRTGVSFPAAAFSIPDIDLNNTIADNNGFPNTGLSEQVLSFYNVPGAFANDQHTGKNAFYFNEINTQTYLRNRVSYTLAYNQGSTEPVRTYFSYDPHGNVTWLIQETPGMDNGKTGSEKLNYRMHLAYDYDLISGKVLKVRFNDDTSRADRFLHRYSYDEDNRLTLVETSRDGYIWDKDAKYDYYLHGPLKRTELGEDKIQGLDYAYTIHGWIKGMNSPILDVNKDLGGDGKPGSTFAPDVWGMSLTFYDGDYVHDNASSFAASGNTTLEPGANYNLYNGNIATWTSALRGVSQNQQIQRAFQYKYDRLNRIKTAQMYEWNGTAWAAAATNNALHTNYSYDGNGNLLTLKRYDKTGSLLDDLTYSYKTKTINNIAQRINQLDKVTDAVTGNKIEKEVTGTNQYDYDDIGNLVRDHAEDIVIVWNMQGKVSEVRPATATSKKPHIRYWYDASGNRLKKEVSYAAVVSDGNGGFVRSFTAAPEKVKVSYYTRDMDGNTMAIYEQKYNATTSTWETTQKELSLYGSERLGTVETNRLLNSGSAGTNGIARLVGEKRYELKDHLTNVRSVVTDQKRYLEAGNVFTEYANVRTFKNYYPFGMEQPGDEVAPVLIPVNLPDGWGIYEMTGWMGSIGLETALKVHLDYVPDTAKWVFGKDYVSTPLQTYEVSFDVALDSLSSSDNELKVTIKDAATDQIIKEATYTTNGTHRLRYLATGDTTKILFHLKDPTPNIGSSLEVTGIALNKTDFGSYRYGFNGKENDQEWGKLIQDYGFRLYNPAIAKFLSVDPLAPIYPELTPYQFASNTPIEAIDLDGLEAAHTSSNKQHSNSGVYFFETRNFSFSFVKRGLGQFTPNLLGRPDEPGTSEYYINLQQYDRVGIYSYFGAIFGGHGSDWNTMGQNIENGRVTGLKTDTKRAYFALDQDGSLKAGLGNPPKDTPFGFGGGIPMLINGQRYGEKNNGKILSARGYANQNSKTVGKVILAHNSKANSLMIVVSPDELKSGGMTLDEIQDYLIPLGYDNIMSFDGGSSSTLVKDRELLVSPDWKKDNTIPVGLKITGNEKK